MHQFNYNSYISLDSSSLPNFNKNKSKLLHITNGIVFNYKIYDNVLYTFVCVIYNLL